MTETWDTIKDADFDLKIVICGYETRSVFLNNQYLGSSKEVIVIDYRSGDLFSYDINKEYYLSQFDERNFVVARSADVFEAVREKILKLKSNIESPEVVSVLFDISSCSRKVMASTLLAISSVSDGDVRLCCTYALATFSGPPSRELPSPISEPVVGDLSGWSDDLSKPPCAVIGLGFEPGRALGCIDYLEIPEVRLFVPQSPNLEYLDAVRSSNKVLIDEAGSDVVFPYDVMSPDDMYSKLDSLIFGLLPRFRPVIIPLGPKIFSIVSMFIAIQESPNLCVWRTSSGISKETTDAQPSGHIAVFRSFI